MLNQHQARSTSFIYDRAAGGPHQAALNAQGMILTTRAMADQPEQESSHFRKPKFIGNYTADCGNVAQFVAIQKQMHLRRISFDGRPDDLPLHHNTYARPYRTRTKHYTSFLYPCTCGEKHTAVFSWNGWSSAKRATKNFINIASEAAYQHALRYLQPFAPNTLDFDALYPHRNITETKHSEMDLHLPFKRLQRWGLPAKSAAISGYLIGMIFVFTAMRDDALMRRLRIRT